MAVLSVIQYMVGKHRVSVLFLLYLVVVMGMAGPDNLRKYYDALTPEQKTAQGKLGAQKSAESRRRYKTQQECLKAILSLKVTDPDVKKALEALGLDPTYAQAVAFAQVNKATKVADGDAARYVRDTVGERPSERHEVLVDADADLSYLSDAELLRMASSEEDADQGD